MKLVSWNVNGIRSVVGKGFLDFFAASTPDILCLQEVRAEAHQANLELPGYHCYWNPAQKKGYSGTAVFSRVQPREVAFGMGRPEHDKEGRLVTLEFDDFFLVNVYTPNSQNDLRRLAYRVEEWDRDFRDYVTGLSQTKPLIFCGDLNVAHTEIDLANPKTNTMSAGFTREERQSFSQTLERGFVDTFRHFNPEPGRYTWWSYRAAARSRNVGWRIDYFCASHAMMPRLKGAAIEDQVLGSDHCPVTLYLHDER